MPVSRFVISGNFDLFEDEYEGDYIRAWLRDKSKRTKLWESERGEPEDTFSLTVDAGLSLEFCIEWEETAQKDDDYPEEAEVGFHIRVHGIPRSLPSDQDGPDMERALHIAEAAVSIETEWSNLMDHFEFLRSREASHLKITNEIMGRIMGWALIEAFVVILMAVCQVMYWRKFFEQRRYL